jgi:hypothetical protein
MKRTEFDMKRLGPSDRKLGFQIHAAVFLLSIALLIGINLWTGPPYWIVWVVPGWGIGVLAHGWFVVGPGAASIATSRPRKTPVRRQPSTPPIDPPDTESA